MRKSALKNLVCFTFPFLAVSLVVYLAFGLSDIYSRKLGNLVSQAAGPDIMVERVMLSPLSGIKMKRVQIKNDAGETMLMESIDLTCSFSELWRRKLLFKRISVRDIEINIEKSGETKSNTASSFSGLPLRSLGKLSSIGPKGKQDGFKVVFDHALFCFSHMKINWISPGQKTQSLVLDFCLDATGQKISCDGRVDYDRSSLLKEIIPVEKFPLSHFEFSFNVDRIGTDVLVNQAKIHLGRYSLSGTGMIRNVATKPVVDVRIYSDPIRLENISALKSLRPKGGETSVIAHLSGSPQELILDAELIMPTLEVFFDGDNLRLDQAICQLQYNAKTQAVNFKECRGIIDENIRFLLTGQLGDVMASQFNLRFELMPMNVKNKNSIQDRNFIITAQGKKVDHGIAADILTRFTNGKDRQYVFNIKDLLFLKGEEKGRRNHFRLQSSRVKLSEMLVTAQEKKTLEDFDFDSMEAKIHTIGKRTFIDRLALSGYGGQVLLAGEVYFNKAMRECRLSLLVDKLDLKDIEVFYPVYFQISGLVSGKINITGKKDITVSGALEAEKFRLIKLEPLDKVADFLEVSSIKEIANAQVITEFNLLSDSSNIKRFDLDNPDMQIRSNFNINTKQWLEGEIALSLPRTTLEQSKIFKTLLSIARERNDLLDFVVRMSGYLWQARTELVKSDFRDKLKEKVSVGIQRYIEREANKAIESQGSPSP